MFYSKLNPPKYVKVLAYLLLANLMVLGIWELATDSTSLLFLCRNLVSSFAPLAIAGILFYFKDRLWPFFFWFGCLAWLLFYPNAPYMISDLIHNHEALIKKDQYFTVRDTVLIPAGVPYKANTFLVKDINQLDTLSAFSVSDTLFVPPNTHYPLKTFVNDVMGNGGMIEPPLVCATLIIFSFAMLSAFCGFLSLKIMFNVFRNKKGKAFANFAITITIILSCLGFYMGRLPSGITYGNGNLYSWELIAQPLKVMKTVWNNLYPPGKHPYAYVMMALFGLAQYMLLIMMKDVNDIEPGETITKQ